MCLQALARYKAIDAVHPGNAECLRYLVHLCSELGRRDDAQKYMEELRKAERLQVGLVLCPTHIVTVALLHACFIHK
jgi:hypothetical protein